MMDVEEMANLYNCQIINILDRLIPTKTVTCQRRSSDPWYDEECRDAKKALRMAERYARRAHPDAAAAAASTWNAQRRVYRQLLRRKRETFWSHKVNSERSSPRCLWQSLDTLLGRGRTPVPDTITAGHFAEYLSEKVGGIWSATSIHEPPIFSSAAPHCSLSSFRTLTIDEVIAGIRALPDKHCSSDPLPTRLLKECSDVLAPYITELFNRSLATGLVPSTFKSAFITPRIKKSHLGRCIC